MENKSIVYFTLLLTIISPAYAFANPSPISIPIREIYVSLIFESLVLAMLLRSFLINIPRFCITWFFITFSTFICMMMIFLLISSIIIDEKIALFIAECLIVPAEAFILRWLLTQSFVLKGKPKTIGCFLALLYSLIANAISFLCGWFFMYIDAKVF